MLKMTWFRGNFRGDFQEDTEKPKKTKKVIDRGEVFKIHGIALSKNYYCDHGEDMPLK